MGRLSYIRCCLLLLSVIYLSSIHSSAKRTGGGGGGRMSSSGGGFGRSSSSGGLFGGGSRSGLFGGGGGRSSWRSPGSGGFGASSRTASATRYGTSSGSGFGGGGVSRYGSSAASGTSGRYGGGLGGLFGRSSASRAAVASPSATRYGSSSAAGGGGLGGSSATRYGSSGGSATRYGGGSPSSGRIGTGTALGAGAAGGALGGAAATRFGGGSYSGLGSSAGKVGAAPTLTRYGSQQSSSGGVFGSSGAAGGSRWGSSAASGRAAGSPMDSMRTRFAGGSAGAVRSPSPSAGNARPNYGSYGGRSAMASRPQVHTPAATRSQPTKVVYSTTYNNYNSGSRYGTGGYGGSSILGGGSRSGFGTGSLIATGLASGVGGYALGRMMGGLSRPYGYGGYGGYGYGGYGGYGYPGYGGMGYGGVGMGGCGMYPCSPYTTYVPYRDRYQEYYPTPSPQPAVEQYNPGNNQAASGVSGSVAAPGTSQQTSTEAPKNIDLCMLARWNRELAFAEMPNMALDFLANNNISGNSTSDKAKFMFEFLTVSVDAYDQYNSSADIFAIPPTFDMNTCNIKVTKNALTNNANAVQSEEPIMTSLRHMLSLYSNKSTNPDDLREVVDAAKACLPQGPTVTSPEVLGCIDFSLSPEQLLKLDVPHSMFGSSEICRRQLSPDMFKCVPKAAGSPCKMEHLQSLNLFARNFYLCSEARGDASPESSGSSNPAPQPSWPASTQSPVIFITTAKPSFWSRIFG